MSKSNKGRLIKEKQDTFAYYSENEGTESYKNSDHFSRKLLIEGSNPKSSRRYSDAHIRKESKIFKLHKKGICTFEKNGKKYIYGGTEQRIILKVLKWLVTESKREYVFHLVSVIINGLRKYHTSYELFKMLISLWNLDTDKQELIEKMRASIMLFLSIWWERYLEIDFVGETEQALIQWFETLPENYIRPLSSKYYKIQNIRKLKSKTIDIFNIHSYKLPSNFKLSDIKSEVLALHIALNSMRTFQKISIHEFYSDKRHNFENMVTKSNLRTKWIIHSILERKNINDRAKMMKKIVKTTSRLLDIHDYNGAMTCWAVLNSVTVHRLQKTKKKLSKSCLNTWKYLEYKLSETKNFSLLRRTIEKRRKEGLPIVPWFELMVKGRNLVEEYPDTLNKKSFNYGFERVPLLNFAKLEHLNELIEEFCECKRNNQDVDLSLDPNSTHEQFQEYLDALPEYTDSELWDMSLICEPKLESEN